ncbi:D-Ala-D-Ala carboxypeptidase family metallohydrolase, partial [Crocosphaera sp.]|uniref:D-Ala-D-Ala carboxypeptidase family metallohydrolase n=1 Tax=Crocosphaera sp. TaxID=2729996 RepID=UPI003F28D1E2
NCEGSLPIVAVFSLQSRSFFLIQYGCNLLITGVVVLFSKPYLGKRRYFYEHGNPKFRQGWLNRLNDLEKYLNKLPSTPSPPPGPWIKPVITPKPTEEFDFLDTYQYWDNLPHQIDAAKYLWNNTQSDIKNHFVEIWRKMSFDSHPKLNYRAKFDTSVKLQPLDSKQLSRDQVARLKGGTELTCIAHEQAPGNHIKVTLEGSNIRGYREWYLFAPHWESTESLPEGKQEISFGKRENNLARPGGPVITVPGIGTVYLNDPIPGTQHFYWYEATHGGQRIPQHESHAQNIIKIARLAEEARAKLGHPLRITSWYRPEPWNSRCGGAKNSVHLRGSAIDFNAGTMRGREMARILSDWPGGMGIYSHYPMLLHLDARDYRARWGGA